MTTTTKTNAPKIEWKKLLLLIILFTTIIPSYAQQTLKVHVGLIYPLSSNGRNASLDTNDLSIHLIAGLSAQERGFSFAGISHIVRYNTYGTQIAGFSNHIGKTAKGALFAGFTNTYRENIGVAFAGFSNIAQGNIQGAQFSGFANIAKQVKGVQFAGFSNMAADVKGSQFAGFLNTGKNIHASQMAGFINIAKDVRGSQFAGFINVANRVTGIQAAGFINIAKSSDCPIGILNFIKEGEKSIGTSINENQTVMLNFRSGGRILYGIIGAGYNFINNDEVYAFEAGFGAHFFSSTLFRLNTELTASTLESFKDGEYFKASLRLFPSIRLAKHFEFFAGPSLNLITTNTVEGKALRSHSLKHWQSRYSDFTQHLTVGYSGGFNIIF